MKNILVVDDQAIVAEPLVIVLRQAGYSSELVTTAAEALMACRSDPPDLLVCDIDMPQASGMDLLRDLRADAATATIPVMMLTNFMDAKTVRESFAYGACDYLIKSDFTLARFLQRVSRHLTGADPNRPDQGRPITVNQPVPGTSAFSADTGSADTGALESQTMPSSSSAAEADTSAIKLITEQSAKYTFSGVVQDILRLVNSPSAAFEDLATILRRDPVLAAKCIAMSNTAAVNTGRSTITNLVDATRLLGFGRVRDMAATIGIFSLLPSGSDSFDNPRCWQHCIATALILERLSGPTSYLTGLCHDMGEVLVRETLNGTAESSWIDRDHGRLRRVALECIGLPTSMSAPILELLSHDPMQGSTPSSGRARMLSMAHCYAHALGFSWSDSAELPELDHASAAEIALIVKIPWDEVVKETMVTMMQVLGGSPPGPRVQATRKRILYVHGDSPQPGALGVALSRLASCVTAARFPAIASDYDRIQAVIVSGSVPHLSEALAAAPQGMRNVPVLVLGPIPTVNRWPKLHSVTVPTLGGILEFLSLAP